MPHPSEPVEDPGARHAPPQRVSFRRLARLTLTILFAYLTIAYVIMPVAWRRYLDKHPALDDVPGITETALGIPGDPLNVALVGSRREVERILRAANWDPADALGLRSDLRIATDTVMERPYDQAPVSSLFLFGRKEDLAFEKPVGDDPRQRNHVRFWRSEKQDPDGRPFWFGSATYDERVGLSRTTGEITHHIAPDVDTERDRLFHDLDETGELSETYVVHDFHKTRQGKNGGGDPWHTDGDLRVGVIASAPEP